MASYKNQLQEIYQKKKLDLPIYSCKNVSDRPHEPEWIATVKTCDGYKGKSKGNAKKTQAENDAAKACLKKINGTMEKIKPKKRYKPPKTPQSILLIDLENVPQAKNINGSAYSHTKIVGFVGKYNNGILKDRDSLETIMDIVVVDTVCKDAADHSLSFHTGLLARQYLETGSKMKFVLLSSDHFAAVLIEMLKNVGYTDSHSITRVEDLEGLI